MCCCIDRALNEKQMSLSAFNMELLSQSFSQQQNRVPIPITLCSMAHALLRHNAMIKAGGPRALQLLRFPPRPSTDGIFISMNVYQSRRRSKRDSGQDNTRDRSLWEYTQGTPNQKRQVELCRRLGPRLPRFTDRLLGPGISMMITPAREGDELGDSSGSRPE